MSTPTAEILIVDDTPANIDVLGETLSAFNCRVKAATSGERALALVARSLPDLILLDVMMPGIDGFETCRRLKSDPHSAGVPVIFVTARHDDVAQGFAAGGADYITKPFQADEVRARVQHQLERRALQLALLAANRTLEDKVRERTAELVVANRMLRQEVNERRFMQDRLNYLATHDFVTRLYNRNALDAHVSDLLVRVQREAAQGVLLLLDIDQFRFVNESCGLLAGDELLRSFAEAVAGQLDSADFFARLGADKFAIVSGTGGTGGASGGGGGVGSEAATGRHGLQLAQRIQQQLDSGAFDWESRSFRRNATIAVVPIGQAVVSFDQLLLMADETLYLAKREGRNQLRLHGQLASDVPARPEQVNWALRLVDALKGGLLQAHFQRLQPLAPALQDEPIRIEVLMRLWDPERQQLVYPASFIGPAERFHMIVDLDRWMLHEVISRLGRLRHLLPTLGQVSINLSAISMRDAQMAGLVLRLLAEHQVPASLICLEITETEAIVNFATAKQFMHTLRQQGCRFALDDFGSGFASYRYLQELSFDSLKIDGAFIRDMDNEPARGAMVRSMLDMAEQLDKPVVAECVESAPVARLLADMGVQWAQGYLYHQPEPLTDGALAALAEGRRTVAAGPAAAAAGPAGTAGIQPASTASSAQPVQPVQPAQPAHSAKATMAPRSAAH